MAPYKKSKASTTTHIVFGVKNTVGALERGLAIFRSFGVDLSHIESRFALLPIRCDSRVRTSSHSVCG